MVSGMCLHCALLACVWHLYVHPLSHTSVSCYAASGDRKRTTCSCFHATEWTSVLQVDPSLTRERLARRPDNLEEDKPLESSKAIKMQKTAQSFTEDDGQVAGEMLPRAASLVPGKHYMLTAAVVSAYLTPCAAEL